MELANIDHNNLVIIKWLMIPYQNVKLDRLLKDIKLEKYSTTTHELESLLCNVNLSRSSPARSYAMFLENICM